MVYQIYLFDLDGTLSDPKEGITKSFQYALKDFGIAAQLDDLAKFIGPPLRESFREFYGFSEADAERAVASFREYFAKQGLFENVVYPHIPALLTLLKAEGKTLGVATNKVKKYAVQTLEHFDLAKFFDFVSGDDMEGTLTKNGKKDIIRVALDELDPKREKASVMIGDRLHDIVGAGENGIDSIGVTWGYGTRRELEEAGASKVVDLGANLGGILLGSV